MKKKLNTDSITNELEGASLFFTRQPSPPPLPESKKSTDEHDALTSQSVEPTNQIEPETIKNKKPQKTNNNTVSRHRDTTPPRNHDTMTTQLHDTAIELIRKAVKEFGKEAATHRFTEAEKKELADLLYTYKNRGIKTSENEITRIAVNFIFQDYKENGENSVLHKILKALKE